MPLLVPQKVCVHQFGSGLDYLAYAAVEWQKQDQHANDFQLLMDSA